MGSVVEPVESPKAQSHSPSSARPRFHLYSGTELETLPDPEYLLDNYIEARAFTVAYGPSGVGKTSVVLDISLSIATGTPWHGLEVRQAPVVYVVGEGTYGIKKLVRAWKQEHGVSVTPDASFVLSAVQLMNSAEVNEFLLEIKQRQITPGLIVFDTLATCFVGGDEKSAQDMGKVIAVVRHIQRETNAAVVLIHHTGKPSQYGAPTERGSSALRGAADTMIRIDATKNGLRVKVDKRKDDVPAPPCEFALKVVLVGEDAKGEDITACVVVLASESDTQVAQIGLTPDYLVALQTLATCGVGDISVQQWLGAFHALTSKSVETLNRRRKWLEKNGYIAMVTKGVYKMTALGHAQSVMLPSRQSDDQTILQPPSHPFRGDGSGGDGTNDGEDWSEDDDGDQPPEVDEDYATWLREQLAQERDDE